MSHFLFQIVLINIRAFLWGLRYIWVEHVKLGCHCTALLKSVAGQADGRIVYLEIGTFKSGVLSINHAQPSRFDPLDEMGQGHGTITDLLEKGESFMSPSVKENAPFDEGWVAEGFVAAQDHQT